MKRLTALTAVAIPAIALSPLIRNGAAAVRPDAPTLGPVPVQSMSPDVAEHRYRIAGKIRLGFFWASRDDVGSARMTWRSDEHATVATMLIGSDPQRAPGGLNRWGFLREEVRSETADVFTLRSEEDPGTRSGGRGGEARFAAACASVSDHDAHTFATTVSAGGATYRMFNHLLDQLASSPAKWNERYVARPLGTEPGFLMALHRVMQSRDGIRQPAVAYLFNNRVYDLSVKRIRTLGRTTVGSRTFDTLARTDLSIRDRTNADETRFAVTSTPDADGVCLPVQIFFQPNFWVSIELRLDDNADVPHDPAYDGALLNQIHDICASVRR